MKRRNMVGNLVVFALVAVLGGLYLRSRREGTSPYWNSMDFDQ